MKLPILTAIFLFGFTACASVNSFLEDDDNVRIEERSSGIYAVIAKSDEKEEAINAATNKANRFCKKTNQMAIILKTEKKYEGLTSEKGSKIIEKIGDAALLLGGPGEVSLASDEMTDDDMYEVQMEFKCK